MSAEAAVVARLREQPALAAYAARIIRGWPADVLQKPAKAQFPRASVMRATDSIRRPGFEAVRVQVDWWVFVGPDDWDLLDSLDEATKDALDEQNWEHEGLLCYALALPSNDAPAGPGSVIRRSRDYEVRTSPAPPEVIE